jgi:hypothetical protein
MQFITSQGFVHMDLAARNCLLHESKTMDGHGFPILAGCLTDPSFL